MLPPTKFELMRANRAKMPPPQPLERIDGKHRKLPIEFLGLGIRTENCCKADRVYTLGDLYDHEALMKMPNLGRKSFDEIQAALKSKGLPSLEP